MSARFFSTIATSAISLALMPAWAQQSATDPPAAVVSVRATNLDNAENTPALRVELNFDAQRLTNGFGNWRDTTLRGTYEGDRHVLQAEFSAKREFGVSGNYLGLTDTVVIDPDWFARASVGAGDGAFYLPRIRADVFVHRKWLPQRNFVSSLGVGYYKAPDGHIDRSLSIGGAYYFGTPWIAEAGVRFNRSNPGDIATRQQFLAITYGRDKHDVLVARVGWGREAYLAIAQNLQLVDFNSREMSLTWRHWIGGRTGLQFGVGNYHNPNYTRRGLNVGVFHQF